MLNRNVKYKKKYTYVCIYFMLLTLKNFKCCGSRDKDLGGLTSTEEATRNAHLKSIFRKSLEIEPDSLNSLFAKSVEKVVEKQADGEDIVLLEDNEDALANPRQEVLKSYRVSGLTVEEVEDSDNSSVDSELLQEIETARENLRKQQKDRKKTDRKTAAGRQTTGDTYGSSRDTVAPFANGNIDVNDEPLVPANTFGRAEHGDSQVLSRRRSTDSSVSIGVEDRYEDVVYRVSQLRSSLRLSSLDSGGAQSAYADDPAEAVLKVKERITKAYMEEEQQNENITQQAREVLQSRISILQADPDKTGD